MTPALTPQRADPGGRPRSDAEAIEPPPWRAAVDPGDRVDQPALRGDRLVRQPERHPQLRTETKAAAVLGDDVAVALDEAVRRDPRGERTEVGGLAARPQHAPGVLPAHRIAQVQPRRDLLHPVAAPSRRAQQQLARLAPDPGDVRDDRAARA